MNIQARDTAAGLRNLPTASTESRQSPVRADVGRSSDTSSKVSVSKPAELKQKLTDLQKADPAQFKQAASEIAAKFKDLAFSSAGPESQGLARLAAAFTQAAETGDVSVLDPGASANAPPPPPAAASSSQTSSSQDAGQNARGYDAYRNAPPPPPPKAIDDALSIVATLSGTGRAAT
jgi:hypothetical protein